MKQLSFLIRFKMKYLIIQLADKLKDYRVIQICKSKNEAVALKKIYEEKSPFFNFTIAKITDDKFRNYGIKLKGGENLLYKSFGI